MSRNLFVLLIGVVLIIWHVWLSSIRPAPCNGQAFGVDSLAFPEMGNVSIALIKKVL